MSAAARGYFAVTRKPGAGWDGSRSMREQEGWIEHAAFMEALAGEGFVVLGGPLNDTVEILLIVDAESEAVVRARLANDPWVPPGLLETTNVSRWEILLERRG